MKEHDFGAPHRGSGLDTATTSGCEAHQSVSAPVHSWARPRSQISKHASITLQYTVPAMAAETSPAVTLSITSSRSARPPVRLTASDQHPAAALSRQADEIDVAEAIADAVRFDERVVRGGEVAAADRPSATGSSR